MLAAVWLTLQVIHETFTKPVRKLWDVHNPMEGSALDQYNGATRALLQLVRGAQAQGVRMRALGGGCGRLVVALPSGPHQA